MGKEPSIKDIRSWGVVQCGQGGGSSDVDVRTFWCKSHRVFRNLWCVRMDKVWCIQKFS